MGSEFYIGAVAVVKNQQIEKVASKTVCPNACHSGYSDDTHFCSHCGTKTIITDYTIKMPKRISTLAYEGMGIENVPEIFNYNKNHTFIVATVNGSGRMVQKSTYDSEDAIEVKDSEHYVNEFKTYFKEFLRLIKKEGWEFEVKFMYLPVD